MFLRVSKLFASALAAGAGAFAFYWLSLRDTSMLDANSVTEIKISYLKNVNKYDIICSVYEYQPIKKTVLTATRNQDYHSISDYYMPEGVSGLVFYSKLKRTYLVVEFGRNSKAFVDRSRCAPAESARIEFVPLNGIYELQLHAEDGGGK